MGAFAAAVFKGDAFTDQQASSLFFISAGEFIRWLMNHERIRFHPATVSGLDHAKANN